jgi:hypothetical protein
MSEDGHLGARLLLPFVQQPADLTRYVAASQVGITVSSLVLGAVGQGIAAVSVAPYMASWFGFDSHAAASVAAALVLVLLTAVQVVIGELVPKSIALRYPTEVALATVLPMRWSLTAFKPLIAVLNGTATSILKLFACRSPVTATCIRPTKSRCSSPKAAMADCSSPTSSSGCTKPFAESTDRARSHGAARPPDDGGCGVAVADALQTAAATPVQPLAGFRGSHDQIVGMLRVKDLVHEYVHEGPPASIVPLIRAVVKVPHDSAGRSGHRRAARESARTRPPWWTRLARSPASSRFRTCSRSFWARGSSHRNHPRHHLVFLAVNALFVGAEFAIIGVSRTAIESRPARAMDWRGAYSPLLTSSAIRIGSSHRAVRHYRRRLGWACMPSMRSPPGSNHGCTARRLRA